MVLRHIMVLRPIIATLVFFIKAWFYTLKILSSCLFKVKGGVRPQISVFLDSCAEFYGLSGEAIENPQFSVF